MMPVRLLTNYFRIGTWKAPLESWPLEPTSTLRGIGTKEWPGVVSLGRCNGTCGLGGGHECRVETGLTLKPECLTCGTPVVVLGF